MASGSIVLFYNDFNRWHHEYQTRSSGGGGLGGSGSDGEGGVMDRGGVEGGEGNRVGWRGEGGKVPVWSGKTEGETQQVWRRMGKLVLWRGTGAVILWWEKRRERGKLVREEMKGKDRNSRRVGGGSRLMRGRNRKRFGTG
ncbi:unnamed protein product [Pleuronectes platessa]|uniref:Uncharacterized protein n=1 Tax=Pleuronectes platessa TaxID=8262 RepID=A0A9N7Y346_PLEPL|nr:unnamed protein product [Pleuronectes platessa]